MILWILGWLFLLPVPFAIVLRRKGINIIIRLILEFFSLYVWALLAALELMAVVYISNFISTGTWQIQSTQTPKPSEVIWEIKGLSFSDCSDLTMKIGKSGANGYLQVELDPKAPENAKYDDSNIEFVSENPDVATIWKDKKDGTQITYRIRGISQGETDVYAASSDGSLKTEVIHVIVPEPVEATGMSISIPAGTMKIGDSKNIEVAFEPEDADDQRLTWSSSDKNIVTVANGCVRAVGPGSATITAVTSNGLSASANVTVSGTRTMEVYGSWSRTGGENIGDDWSFNFTVNGSPVQNSSVMRDQLTMSVSVGQVINLSARIKENDDNPDVGTGSASYTVKAEDIVNGFTTPVKVTVTENGGRNSGHSAYFEVTFHFTPVKD